MISYNHKQSKRALQIRDYLQKEGKLKVWIDVEEMSGNIFKRMAEAVINSKIIIFCCSQDYEASDNCRREYEYAAKKKKPIIPIFVEDKFEAREADSLDIILGMKLYYKVEEEPDFKKNMPKILQSVYHKFFYLWFNSYYVLVSSFNTHL